MSWKSRRKKLNQKSKNTTPPELTRHHRHCRSVGGSDHPKNISMVSATKHRAYHTLFRNWSPYQIARELNTIWLDPDYMLVAVRRDEYSGAAIIG